MPRPRLALALAACAAFCGCAGSELQTAALRSLAAKHLVVSLPEEIPFPDTMDLELQPAPMDAGLGNGLNSEMMASLGSSSLAQKVYQSLKNSAASPGADLAEAMARELRGSGIFAGVNNSGGEATLQLRVSRFGIAYDAGSGRYQLLLDLDAELSVGALGVIWRASRSASDLSTAVSSKIPNLDPGMLGDDPQKLSSALHLASADLCQQLVADLQKKTQ